MSCQCRYLFIHNCILFIQCTKTNLLPNDCHSWFSIEAFKMNLPSNDFVSHNKIMTLFVRKIPYCVSINNIYKINPSQSQHIYLKRHITITSMKHFVRWHWNTGRLQRDYVKKSVQFMTIRRKGVVSSSTLGSISSSDYKTKANTVQKQPNHKKEELTKKKEKRECDDDEVTGGVRPHSITFHTIRIYLYSHLCIYAVYMYRFLQLLVQGFVCILYEWMKTKFLLRLRLCVKCMLRGFRRQRSLFCVNLLNFFVCSIKAPHIYIRIHKYLSSTNAQRIEVCRGEWRSNRDWSATSESTCPVAMTKAISNVRGRLHHKWSLCQYT